MGECYTEAMDSETEIKCEHFLEVERRFVNSAELIRQPIKEEKGVGQVFIQADEIVKNGFGWTINIDSGDSTVVLDDGARESLGLGDLPLVKELRSGDGNKKLVSAGTWIWLKDGDNQEFLVLVRRDEGTFADAGCLTGQAKRCGEKLSQTVASEINQELIFVKSENKNEKELLVFYQDENEKELMTTRKLEQVEKIKKALTDRGDIKSLEEADFISKNVVGRESLRLLPINKSSSQNSEEIIMTIDGKEVDRIRGVVYMDDKNKTLEIREVEEVFLPNGLNVDRVLDGELFLRSTVLVKKENLADLLEDNLVPTLEYYIKKLTEQIKSDEK